MFPKILLAALIAAFFIFLIWLVRGAMLMPLRVGRKTKLTVNVCVTGPEPNLEETLDGLIWLAYNDTIPADIVVEDAGMDEETKEIAELMARDHACLSFKPEEADEPWQEAPPTPK